MNVELSRAGLELVMLDGQLHRALENYNRWRAREAEAREQRIAALEYINKVEAAIEMKFAKQKEKVLGDESIIHDYLESKGRI